MTASHSLFGILRQSADADCVAAVKRLVADASDHQLSRINVLAFARSHELDEEKAIAAFLHAARIGLFELSWNVLCPGCGGVLDASATLKSVHAEEYHCALCAAGYAPTLDEMVEVTFTVSPRIRRIAAHDPHTLPTWEYYRQVFWGSGVDLPNTDFAKTIEHLTLDSVELPPGEKAHLSLTQIYLDQVFGRPALVVAIRHPTADARRGPYASPCPRAPRGANARPRPSVPRG